jgi:hypothetical protein
MFWNCLGAWWFELFFSSWDDGCLGTSFSDWSMERILARSAPRRAPWVPGIWKGFEEGPDAASCPSSFRFIDSTLLSIRILFCKQWEYHVASKRGPFGEDFLHLLDIYIYVYTHCSRSPQQPTWFMRASGTHTWVWYRRRRQTSHSLFPWKRHLYLAGRNCSSSVCLTSI